jgi:murein DD-endopeptidase MepM/ murein hydrolase activator NlpD
VGAHDRSAPDRTADQDDLSGQDVPPAPATGGGVPEREIAGLPRGFAAPVPNPRIRGQDAFGSGHFGAGRGNRTHQGVDILAEPGQEVTAPVTGRVTNADLDPYPRDPARRGRFSGVEITTNDGYRVRMLYIGQGQAPLQYGQHVTVGETQVGTVQDISGFYGLRNGGRMRTTSIWKSSTRPAAGSIPRPYCPPGGSGPGTNQLRRSARPACDMNHRPLAR